MSDDNINGLMHYLNSVLDDSGTDSNVVSTFTKMMRLDECTNMMLEINNKSVSIDREIKEIDPILDDSEIETFCRNLQTIGSDYLNDRIQNLYKK